MCSPKHTSSEQLVNKLVNNFSFFETLRCTFYSCDYNAKYQCWGSRLTNPKGRALHKTIINKRLNTISQSMPIYWPTDKEKYKDRYN